MDKMREEFNEWFDSNHKTESESLNFAISEAMFDAWKASRAALCVELPQIHNVKGVHYDLDGYDAELIEEALSSAGVQYK